MSFLEECVVAFAGGILFTQMFGAVGIWYALVVADIAPLILYGTVSLLYQRSNKDRIKSMLLLKDTNTVTWTYMRGKNELDHYLNDDKKGFIQNIEKMLNEKTPKTIDSLEETVKNILKDEKIESIDVTIIQVDEKITITLTYEGELINPITEETIEHIEEIDGDIEYNPILGFNRAYINIPI